MPGTLKNILIPVDLSINTELAVKKGLELSDSGTAIHLLYVLNNSFFSFSDLKRRSLLHSGEYQDVRIISNRLKQWKQTIEESSDNIAVCIWVVVGNIQKTIEKKVSQLSIDLVIIGKKSHHSWLPFLNTVVSNNIVMRTGVAVFTAKPGSLHNKNKVIVVPVTGPESMYKFEALSFISRKFRIKVYLVTFSANHKSLDVNTFALLEMYKKIRQTLFCSVDYVLLDGHNKAKAVLHYAKKINADILLLSPLTETRIGWMNNQISDMISPASKIQVLTVRR